RSVACITATHGGRFEELFSEGSGVFSDLESTAVREASGPVGSGLSPSSHRHQTSSPCLFCFPVDPCGPPVNKSLFVVGRVFGRDALNLIHVTCYAALCMIFISSAF